VNKFAKMKPAELLKLHAGVSEELRARGILRSSNNPTGDLAECLFCKAFGWKQAGNSNANVDAISRNGKRYQIKGRRFTHYNQSRQLSAIRTSTRPTSIIWPGCCFPRTTASCGRR
jgi:hypothetical protein